MKRLPLIYLYYPLVLILAIVSDVIAYEECYSTYSYTYYCEDGYYCCDNDTRCCFSTVDTLGVGTKIGIAIGSIFAVIVVVVVIRAVVKHKNHPGRVIQPQQTGGVAFVTQTTAHPYDQPMQGQTSYGQPTYGQPTYGAPPPYGGDKVGSLQATTAQGLYPPPPPTYQESLS